MTRQDTGSKKQRDRIQDWLIEKGSTDHRHGVDKVKVAKSPNGEGSRSSGCRMCMCLEAFKLQDAQEVERDSERILGWSVRLNDFAEYRCMESHVEDQWLLGIEGRFGGKEEKTQAHVHLMKRAFARCSGGLSAGGDFPRSLDPLFESN